MNTLLIGITATIIIFKVQNGADQHPRKGLWDGEKVIEWLDHYADSYTYFSPDEQETGFIGQMFDDLRKAMEKS